MNKLPHAPARICVIGSANVDLTFRTPRLPAPGETISGHSLVQGMGGKGANQAVAAARLGSHVTLVARVGDDTFGADAIAAFRADRIDTEFVRQSAKSPTGTAAILVDDRAENSIVVIAGANAELTVSDVQAAAPAITAADVVLCQLETPARCAVEAFRLAREPETLAVLTPAPAQHITDALLELCDVCVPNRSELASLTNLPTASDDEVRTAARALRHRGVRQVVVTLGAGGALLYDGTEFTHIPARAVDAVDTTGAGDAFTAGLAVAMASGRTLTDAARRATEAAAISVTRSGTQTSFPHLNDVPGWRA